jgi:hypothetical protein
METIVIPIPRRGIAHGDSRIGVNLRSRVAGKPAKRATSSGPRRQPWEKQHRTLISEPRKGRHQSVGVSVADPRLSRCRPCRGCRPPWGAVPFPRLAPWAKGRRRYRGLRRAESLRSTPMRRQPWDEDGHNRSLSPVGAASGAPSRVGVSPQRGPDVAPAGAPPPHVGFPFPWLRHGLYDVARCAGSARYGKCF